MSDNQSFLRLIGFDSQSESASDSERSVKAAVGSDIVESVSGEFEAGYEVSDLQSVVDEAKEDLTNEELSNEELSNEELTKTEAYTNTRGDQTAIYSESDLHRMGFSVEQSSEHIEPTEPEFTEKVVEEQETPEMHQEATGTVPYDPDGASPHVGAQSDIEGGTQHFDYDEEQAISRLVVLEGQTNARAFHLSQLPLKIGRDPQNDVVLDDVNSSRFHAEIRDQEGQIIVVDLGSTNGLKVNGLIVTERVLQSHDVIQVGDCLFEYLLPGELSRGAPQSQVLSDTASGHVGSAPLKKNKKVLLLSVVLILGGLGYFFTSGRSMLRERAEQVVVSQAQGEFELIKENLTTQYQKPIEEIPANEIKKIFLDRVQNSALSGMIPSAIKQQIESLPPDIIKILVDDPAMIQKFITAGGDFAAVEAALREKLNELIVQKRYVLALGLSKSLLQLTPNNQSLQQAVKQLEEMTSNAGSPSKPKSEDEKKFFDYIDKFDKNYEALVKQKKFSDAMDFARTVRDKLGELLKLEPYFESVGRPEAEKWDARIASLEVQTRQYQQEVDRQNSERAEMENSLQRIQGYYTAGQYGELQKEVDLFLKKYPGSEEAQEVIQIKQQIAEGAERSFRAVEEEVERFIQTESYENAWKKLYLFIDMMPDYSGAQKLKQKLTSLTQARAAQYYNQARVYEYEADDLIAAEQHYKHAIDLADPRSDLYKKSVRRFNDVKRKSMK